MVLCFFCLFLLTCMFVCCRTSFCFNKVIFIGSYFASDSSAGSHSHSLDGIYYYKSHK